MIAARSTPLALGILFVALPATSAQDCDPFDAPGKLVGVAYPTGVASGDLNGDSWPDFAVSEVTGSVAILLADGQGGFLTPNSIPTGTTPTSVAIDDLNSDGSLDVVVSNQTSGTVSVLLGNGSGSFGSPTISWAGNTLRAVGVADLNSDGALDLALATGNGASILLGDGLGGFSSPTNFQTNYSSRTIAIGDLNADGKLDLALTNGNAPTISILLGDGAGSFANPSFLAAGIGPEGIAIDDLNGDGLDDVVATNYQSGDLSVFLGTGSGGLSPASQISLGSGASGPSSVSIGDVDGDSIADLCTANALSKNASLLRGDGLGGFGAPIHIPAGLGPRFALLADLNRDSSLDLVVADYDSHDLTIIANACGCETPSHGSGCPGSGGYVPTLTMTGCLGTGSAFTLEITNALGPSIAQLFIGFGPASISLGGGCSLLVFPLLPQAIVLPVFGPGAGNGEVQLTSVMPPVVVGGSVSLQAFVADSGSPLGFSATNGITAVIP